jgi:hypothetical protein
MRAKKFQIENLKFQIEATATARTDDNLTLRIEEEANFENPGMNKSQSRNHPCSALV